MKQFRGCKVFYKVGPCVRNTLPSMSFSGSEFSKYFRLKFIICSSCMRDFTVFLEL